ncbi:uncharacterized protein LOC119100311 [Pollicipes pollicipes]|uniref:uncharacterized protein LOC119100311 n=1 Tax=Pollicipes pollicipes TaxID=41117 RepID=UPI0018856265|nr:uncharacterized protein LOC119100311 [Pollicipes pollicipes]
MKVLVAMFVVLAVAAAGDDSHTAGEPRNPGQQDALQYWMNLLAPFAKYAGGFLGNIPGYAPGGDDHQAYRQNANYGTSFLFTPVVGSFSYLDFRGVNQTVDFAVDESGFRISGTNLAVNPPTEVTTSDDGYRK